MIEIIQRRGRISRLSLCFFRLNSKFTFVAGNNGIPVVTADAKGVKFE
ncbi:MAG: hypothetical protein LBF85_10040 [Tannerella sp.]|nr:hypothetical protein [Tannerella sp.]